MAGDDWAAHLDRLGICDERHRHIATEAALLGGHVAKGIHPMLAIASLKKTCRMLGVSFWAYLTDRLTNAGKVPPLADRMSRTTSF